MKHATTHLLKVLAELPATPQEIAPDQYELYAPSFQEEVEKHTSRSSASNAATRVIGKGLFSVKGLIPEGPMSRLVDEDIQNLVSDALALRED